MKKMVALFLVLALMLCACNQDAKAWQERIELGLRFLDEGNYEPAIVAFTSAIEIDPRNPEAYVYRGDAYTLAAEESVRGGDMDTALEYLDNARKDYEQAQLLEPEEDYDLPGRLERLEQMQEALEEPPEQVLPTEPPEDLVQVYTDFFYTIYDDSDWVVLADITGDGAEEMLVVCYEDPDGNRITGHVYTLGSDGVTQIYENWGSTSHAGGFYGWYLVEENGAYHLAEESFGMWQGMGTLSFTEYTLDSQGNKTVVAELVLDSSAEGNHDENGMVTENAYDRYQDALCQRLSLCWDICHTWSEGTGYKWIETFPPAVFGTMDHAPVVEVPVTAEDQYAEVFQHSIFGHSYCFHIPQFVWNGHTDLMINEQIYFDHMGVFSDSEYEGEPNVSAVYSMGQANGIASVVTAFSQQMYEYTTYSIFYLDTATGQEATTTDLMAAFGYTQESFREQARVALEYYFLQQFGQSREMVGAEFFDQCLEKTLEADNVAAVRPFVDEAGRLCMVAKVYSFAGAEAYYHRVCLDGTAATPQWQECPEHG